MVQFARKAEGSASKGGSALAEWVRVKRVVGFAVGDDAREIRVESIPGAMPWEALGVRWPRVTTARVADPAHVIAAFCGVSDRVIAPVAME